MLSQHGSQIYNFMCHFVLEFKEYQFWYFTSICNAVIPLVYSAVSSVIKFFFMSQFLLVRAFLPPHKEHGRESVFTRLCF